MLYLYIYYMHTYAYINCNFTIVQHSLMKKILFFIAFISPLMLSAQTQNTDSLMNKLMVGLENQNWEEVTTCFHQFANENPESAEVFYWVKAYDKSALSDVLLLWLAKSYYNKGKQDKALDLVKTYYKNSANLSVGALLDLAQFLTDLGEVRLTQSIYKEVIKIEPNNLNANLFLGNYLYIRAERERKRVSDIYDQKKRPTRMQYAEYREKLKELYNASYIEAREYLQKAYRMLASAELKETIDHIDEIKKQVL